MREHARFQVSGCTKDHKFHFGGRSETPNWTAEAAASHAFHFHHHDGSVLPHTHRTHQRSAAAHCVITPAITREGSRELQWHFTHTHMVTHTHLCSSHPHVSCVSVQILHLLLSARGGSVTLMTFPMCHKRCTWEAESSTVSVHLLHICMSL